MGATQTNRLAGETSPYLRQHAHNPVDWYPWGPEALGRAKEENRPILLSVGYSACHWCHVMERESFENEEIARIMNEHFVCVKVDREERPDLDEIYMNAVQMMTGQGGWPLTVFLTPDAKPFFGGTYFPPEDRWGMPGFATVLRRAAEAFRLERANIENSAGQVQAAINGMVRIQPGMTILSGRLIDQAAAQFLAQADVENGGFGGAPKFPHSLELQLLLRHWRRSRDESALACVRLSLDRMACGGIYDQLGGGFHRYSVDAEWRVPHFEKMLYDNALIPRVYLEGFQETRNPFYRRVVEETLDYVLREMAAPEGGFYCAQDADSEGVEGKYYVWTPQEILEVLGTQDGKLACDYFGLTEPGNFEHGWTVLSVPVPDGDFTKARGLNPAAWAQKRKEIRHKLLAAREKRVKPEKDEKILASWSALMTGTLAQAARVLDRPDYLEAAAKCARFLLKHMIRNGRLFHAHRDGVTRLNAYLDDYAYAVSALLDLYEATFDLVRLKEALSLNKKMLELFWDGQDGGFFFTSHDHEDLIARSRSPLDGVVPSGNSVAVMNLLRLHELILEVDVKEMALKTLRLLGELMGNMPMGVAYLLAALDFHLEPPLSVVIAAGKRGGGPKPLLAAVDGVFFPNKVVSLADPEERAAVRLLSGTEGKNMIEGRPTAYVCQDSRCLEPVQQPEALANLLKGAVGRDAEVQRRT